MKKIFVLLNVFLVSFLLQAQDVSQEERDALMAFYYATDGPNWTNNTNWGSAEPVNTWYGVSAFYDTVDGISLTNNGLKGEIPAEIGVFVEMNGLYLGHNELTSIPPEIINLRRLGWCDLSHNKLGGPLPGEIFMLGNMIQLNLSYNEFTGEIPVEIGTPTSITWLDLGHNQLSGNIPSEIENLTSTLQQLYLNDNQLSGSVPVELNNMVMLSDINFSNNKLTGTFTGLPGFYAFPSNYIINNNYFTFEGIEAISALAAGVAFDIGLIYHPQLTFPLSDNEIEVNLGQNISIDIQLLSVNNLGGANNRYEWFKNGVSVSALSASPLLNIVDVAEADLGTYVCQVTNVIITDLTLISEEIIIKEINQSPIVSQAISDRVLISGFGSASGNVSRVFSDPDGDMLTHTASSENTSVVEVSMAGDWITVTEVGIGTSLITITADDGNGGLAKAEFYLSVVPSARTATKKNTNNDAFALTANNSILSPDLSFRIYPNPSNGKFNVERSLSLNEKTTLTIIDATGKAVFQKKLVDSKIAIDLTENGKGMYLIHFETNGKINSKKVFVK